MTRVGWKGGREGKLLKTRLVMLDSFVHGQTSERTQAAAGWSALVFARSYNVFKGRREGDTKKRNEGTTSRRPLFSLRKVGRFPPQMCRQQVMPDQLESSYRKMSILSLAAVQQRFCFRRECQEIHTYETERMPKIKAIV